MEEIKSIEKCFQVLDLKVTASFAEVKEAHRFLVQAFHEDKYPVDSPLRVKAMEKMIEINDAYHKLKNFFAENPDGWKVVADGSEGGGDGDDEMDWQSWQRKQENKADDAVKEWQEEEQIRRIKIKLEEERTQRKTLVNFGMLGAWLVVGVMWMGHGCTGAEHQYSDGSRLGYFRDALNYKESMGTATSADYEHLQAAKNEWNGDAEKNNGSMIVLYSMLAGLGYLSVFPKPRRCLANWIENATFVDPELGAKVAESKSENCSA
jgi:hypothetical protein